MLPIKKSLEFTLPPPPHTHIHTGLGSTVSTGGKAYAFLSSMGYCNQGELCSITIFDI